MGSGRNQYAEKSMQVNTIKKLIGVFGLCLGIGLVIAGNFMWDSWIKNGPTQMDEARGIIYPYNHGGRIVYLDFKQRSLIYGIPIIGLGVGAIVWFASKRILDSKNKG